MTPAELYRYFQQKADTAYSGYVDTTRANRFFRQGLINTIQAIYNNRYNIQNSQDEISYLIAAGQVFNVNPTTNSMFLGDHYIPVTSMFPVGTTVTVTST